MTRTVPNRRRSRTSCSIIALATALAVGPTPAVAESFHGVGVIQTNTGGAANIDQSVLNQTNVTLNPGNTVINWTPTDNAINNNVGINFQTVGTVANFSSTNKFAVLNNILPQDTSRAIHMSGTVNGLVGLNQGGSIYFYSPSGFVFASTSTFNVASLGVSALPISNASFANLGDTGYGTLTFGQAENTAASIIMNGTVNAFVPALGFGGAVGAGYVAMVAPRVVQNSTSVITANGSTALVAAEAATITFSADMLFDIQVTVGTTDTNGIVVHGDIGGHTPTGSSDKQGVYLVAVPKNQALTMVIGAGADLGFTLADTAVDDNGTIVLSAGHDIVDGTISAKSAGHDTGSADLWFTGAHATNNVVGEATGSAYLYSAGGLQSLTTFDNNVTVHGAVGAHIQSFATGSLLSVGGDVSLSSNRTSSVAGGSAMGGSTSMFADDNGIITIAGNLSMTADGTGGNSSDPILAGNGTGGSVSLSASDSGSITVGDAQGGGDVYLSAIGTGGTGFDGGSGTGTGGTVSVSVSTNGDLTIFGDTDAYAEGRGGTNWDGAATGGTGQGGNIFVNAADAGSTLSLSGALMSANGIGGGAGEGTCCAAVGGSGLGGLVNVFASSGGSIQSNGTLEFSAAGEGGWASGIGGSGIGGQNGNGDGVFVNSQSGGTIDVTGSLWLDATGSGGDGDNGGGDGSGGYAQLYVSGGTVDVSGEVNVDADGFGGDSDFGGDGGNGIAGTAEVLLTSINSLLTVGDLLLVEADGTGGESFNFEGPLGDGGDGTGGRAGVYGDGGILNANGGVTLSADGTGGFGEAGGDGTGKLAELVAAGGTVNVTGFANVSADGQGGDGSFAGGHGFGGGERLVNFDGAHIFAQNGAITLNGDANVSSSGFGGAGDNGGSGGDGEGGFATIHAANSNSGPSSVTINNVESTAFVKAEGHGGAGGDGTDGFNAGNGGAGGDGTGGWSSITAAAGNGTVTVRNADLSVQAWGGAGGDGGNSDGGTGGHGGVGGDAIGGQINVGTESGAQLQAAGSNLGVGNYETITANASAFGGAGGNGTGGTTNGNGGNGGDAFNGGTTLLVRGSTVNADTVLLVANATGGNAGFGAVGEVGTPGVTGIGGDATVGGEGGLLVLVTERFFDPPGVIQRGMLNAGSITGTAIATGGIGIPNGNVSSLGESGFSFHNSDGEIGSFNFTIGLAENSNSQTILDNEFISIIGGTVDIEGTFAFTTPGNQTFYIDQGWLSASAINLTAGNFITDPVNPSVLTDRGTAFADTINIISEGDFIADADLDIANGIGITVPGSIRFGNATSAAHVDLRAQAGSLQLDNVTAGDYVSLDAGTNMTVGVIAGSEIDLDAGGNILFTSASATSDFDFDAGGSVTGGNVTAVNEISGNAGGSVSLGNLTAGTSLEDDFSVGISAIGNISVGNVSGPDAVGFATQGNLLTGTISAGDLFLALVGGNVTTGAITTSGEGGGQVYIADDSMFLTGGGTWDGEGDFNPATVLAEDPEPTGGAITINGAINTGRFRAAAGTSLTTGAINSSGDIGLAANGSITTGNLVAGAFVLANAGSITTGNIDADSVDMTSTDGNITTLDILADGAVALDASGNIDTGDITASAIDLVAGNDIDTDNLTTEQQVVLTDGFTALSVPGASITLNAGGDITTGEIDSYDGVFAHSTGGSIETANITAATFVTLAALGDLTTDNINAGGLLLGLAHGDMVIGNVIAGEVFLADYANPESGGGGSLTNCIGNCGSLGPDGVVTAPPSGGSYSYVSTYLGEEGAGRITVEGTDSSTNGSEYTTAAFDADAGDILTFWFNYVTSDGGNFADYAWAALLTAAGQENVATLYTARTRPEGSIVPGFGLPGVEATLDPTSVPIIDGAPEWSPLGEAPGTCFGGVGGGCGYTGWVSSTYEIAESGNYVLRLGVSNWLDEGYNTGMAFSGITIGGVPVPTGPTRTGGSITIGVVDTGKFTAAAGANFTATSIDASTIFADAGGNISTGVLNASGFIELFADGNIATGSIDAGGNLLADADGSITFNGAVDAAQVHATAGTGLTTQAVNAEDATVFAGGLATINGAWNVGDAKVISNDIDITASGSIAADGDLTLVSKNATRTIVGDGVALPGYNVSNVEFGKLSANDVTIIADTSEGAAPTMLIGTLNANAAGFPGGIDYEFLTGNGDTEIASGSIRVVGNAVFNGMTTEDHSVNFGTALFELDAATGSVSLFSSGSTLGGELGLYANRIHVAEGSILNQLASNPTYTGYQQDLNEAATVPRPEGVLRADTLWIESDNLQDVLIQNTGTAQTPAGFLVRQAFINDDEEVAGPAGSINLVVNGQVVTEGGTLTGVAARDALVTPEDDITPFTSNSTINGCPLIGVCVPPPPPPPPPGNDSIDNFIDLFGDDPLGDSEFGNEEDIDDGEEGDEGANNPISPPQPLFDTRPLIPGGDVNDPVSGTGNPALLGSDQQCEEGEGGQCPANPANGDGQ